MAQALQAGKSGQLNGVRVRPQRLMPVAQAVALLVATSGMAQAQQAFSPAWFAAKGAVQQSAAATGYLPNGTPVSALTNPAQQQQQANATLQRSINNLSQMARGIAAQQAAQEAARQAAVANGASVPDGLGEGGLKVDTNSLTQGWVNAQAASQSVTGGKTTVAIQQTADRAILNWETFNVGKNTLVNFRQDPGWAVLNRVNDPAARPSQIQGQIAGNGTVMIVNRNGVVFSGSSQVDVRNLVAAAATITDGQFRERGLYGPNNLTPSFTDAGGKLVVQAGARIATARPQSVTEGGGYVLLLGREVSNAGEIATPRGQAALVAGDSFIIRRGVGTEGNATSTTRGNEVAPLMAAGSTGRVVNQGLIVATEGDVTLAGRDVAQQGVALATTTVNTRGTVHLLNSVSDAQGQVNAGAGAITAVLLDDDGVTTALNSQRDALIAESAKQDALRGQANAGNFDLLSVSADRKDLSRIEIVSGGKVTFETGSMTAATGGQIVAGAGARNFVAQGAVLDVSGAVGVQLAMQSNNVKINIQGNELRDAPVNRDATKLFNSNVWLDVRGLTLLPAGTGGYASDRWYSPGGLLEVGGYLNNTGHRIGEWAAAGGTLQLGGREVITQAGSSINLSGGSLTVQTGYLNRSWLRGSDGVIYSADNAPADMVFSGVFQGFESTHVRWGKDTTEIFSNAWIAPQRVLENGYTVGRDAGRLVLSTPTAVIEGEVLAQVVNGARQTSARASTTDSYRQGQFAVARAGQLAVGQYGALGREDLFDTDVRIGQVANIADALRAGDALAGERINTLWLDAQRLNDTGWGGIDIATRGGVAITGDVRLVDGAVLTLAGATIDIDAKLTIHGGQVNAGNTFSPATTNNGGQVLRQQGQSHLRVGEQGGIDLSGRFTNARLQDAPMSDMLARNGGSITLSNTDALSVARGALLDVSSGAAIAANGSRLAGRGGNITLSADIAGNAGTPAALVLQGSVAGYGGLGGGTLTLETGRAMVMGFGAVTALSPAELADAMVIDPALLSTGFGNYVLSSRQSLVVSAGTVLAPTVPVYRWRDGADTVASGSAPTAALALWQPPVVMENAAQTALSRRVGASLRLDAGGRQGPDAAQTVVLALDRTASIVVDPGQRIALGGVGQITIDGQLHAPGGTIDISTLGVTGTGSGVQPLEPATRTLWIGEQAVLDVAGRATTAVDSTGRRYGLVQDGGSIVLGGNGLFVVTRPGALLEASGSGAWLDLPTGATWVGGAGGSIAASSLGGLYLEGEMRAAAGGPQAAGGTLALTLNTGVTLRFNPQTDTDVKPRELILTQLTDPAAALAGATPQEVAANLRYGHGRLSVEQVQHGGFDNLALDVAGQVSFGGSLDLRVGQSLRVKSFSLALGETGDAATRAVLYAPYVVLAGYPAAKIDNSGIIEVSVASGTSTRPAAGSLTVNADLLDITDRVYMGVNGTLPQVNNGTLTVDRRSFAETILHSSGDLRLLAATNINSTTLAGVVDLRLEAAQIYPVTGATAIITAKHLTTARTTTDLPQVPYSVYGSLSLIAETIEHGGVLRAPLGDLSIGTANAIGLGQPSDSVRLLAGSESSVSAAGLVMPYGGTVDGVAYLVDGVSIANNLLGRAPMAGIVRLNGKSVQVEPGAVIDLSGGGDLKGAGFISGRGGSVDVLRYAMAAANPALRYSKAGNQVYAIVPGSAATYAPSATTGNPAVGQQLVLTQAIPGLAAGTYTLLPAAYALMPGAFRVEVPAGTQLAAAVVAAGQGSYMAPGLMRTANTQIVDTLPRQVLITPADVVRTQSQYLETGLTQFALADAARLGVPRVRLPGDARRMEIALAKNDSTLPSFAFDGELRATPVGQGWASQVTVGAGTNNSLEILPNGGAPTPGFVGVSVDGGALSRLQAGQLLIGGKLESIYGQGGNYLNVDSFTREVHVRSGASLSASDIFLISALDTGGIFVEQGAQLNTLGRGKAGADSSDGFIYAPLNHSMLVVSNGLIKMLAPQPTQPNTHYGPGRIEIGGCTLTCSGVTGLYSEGTIAAATDNLFRLDDAVRYGTRNLTLAVGGVNIGTSAGLAAAEAQGRLPAGLLMSQSVLDNLLRGDTSTGAPALETLTLTSREAINLVGTVTLDTIDAATGRSRLNDFVLTAPGMYGSGQAGDVATIRTGKLTWAGATTASSAVLTNGPGTGAGTLNIIANQLEFGEGADTAATANATTERLILGFATVNLTAAERLTANHASTLSVYQHQGAYTPGSGYSYSGGDLNIVSPLLTGEAASRSTLRAGGDVRVSGLPGAANVPTIDRLGAELSISGRNVSVDTNIVLPSGKLTLQAERDLVLGDQARIDVSGRTIAFNDVSRYSQGGEVNLVSQSGNISQSAGSRIDLSARLHHAGQLNVTAQGMGAGMVDLQGAIVGQTMGEYDAGGTWMPFRQGEIDVRAQRLGSGSLDAGFAALNERLNAGGVTGARLFQLGQGDLTVGNELRASVIDVSVDGGRMTVTGKVDASGVAVGSIRLAARDGLTIAGSALLDAHGERLRVDSYGQVIDSPNRALVELGTVQGTLVLAAGARVDLRHGTASQQDAVARGSLELNAPALGANDVGIDAAGPVTISGARSISVNAVARYSDAPTLNDNVSGRPYQWIDQAYMDGKAGIADTFITAAHNNAALMNGKLAGLNNAQYRQAFHLRPVIEIDAAGDLVVKGDLDMSRYRFDSVNPNFIRSNPNNPGGIYGSGEVGGLVLRAAGSLDILGSINDGFAPPPATPDDHGWVLMTGLSIDNTDIVIPRSGISLAAGTTYRAGVVLNYDLPIQPTTIKAGTRLPAQGELASDTVIPANTVLGAAVRRADGTVLYAAGTRFVEATTLQAGLKLDAGWVLTGNTKMAAMVWPKGVALPHLPSSLVVNSLDFVTLDGDLAMKVGALIPAGTEVVLPGGVTQVNLRDGAGTGTNWAVAPMLAPGLQSWSVRLVAGADLNAADNRRVLPAATRGDASLRLADVHYAMRPSKHLDNALLTDAGAIDNGGSAGTPIVDFIDGWGVSVEEFCSWGPYCYSNSPPTYTYAASAPSFSVLRTGTGELDLISAGDLSMQTLYGVYTAGSPVMDAATARAQGVNRVRGKMFNYASGGAYDEVLGPQGGEYEQLVNGGADSLYQSWYPDGGGNLRLSVGRNLTGDQAGSAPQGTSYLSTGGVGNWLWRQGSGDQTDTPIPTAWWINFGTYVAPEQYPMLVGFTGFGTLGGGNLSVRVAGDAGMLAARGNDYNALASRSEALVLAVGSTGRLVDGQLKLTGGGDLDLRVSGGINPVLEARAFIGGGADARVTNRHDLNGALTNLRGSLQVQSGSLGGIALQTGSTSNTQDPKETRAYDPYVATVGAATGGSVIALGDATLNVATRGDLIVGAVIDPGRVPTYGQAAFTRGGVAIEAANGFSWFSLWTANTAVDLLAAGGNLTPITALGEVDLSGNAKLGYYYSATDGRFVYPSILRATAASGSIYVGQSAAFDNWNFSRSKPEYSMLLAPGPNGELALLAANSLYAGGYAITPTSADESVLATPAHPGFSYFDVYKGTLGNGANGTNNQNGSTPLFVFDGTSAGSMTGADAPARFYARDGDIVGLRTGEILSLVTGVHRGETWYEGARRVAIVAGRDIINSGTQVGKPTDLPGGLGGTSEGNLIVHSRETDVSVVSAGRDMIYSSFAVAGPGTLEVSAGRHIQMDDRAWLRSIGPVLPGDTRDGATIAVMAGNRGLDFAAVRARYLDPANLAVSGMPLADQVGKVVKTYQTELREWLAARYGFAGSTSDALAYFDGLAGEQQRVFLRTVFMEELREGGREYNNPDNPRFGSYLRGRAMIATLLPEGQARTAGDLVMYGGAGIHTDFGGGIDLVVPGGKVVVGVQGAVPPASAGVLTQGRGDIRVFSQDSLSLGLSRVMTTFGGDILAWSERGDINAGRGSKTTVLFTPPKLTYDDIGNVKLAPQVPSSGAGIATLNPIAEVAPGDVDLIAPLGTIDAGEAGIRVSGNVNLAALQVVNAANIQVQGKSTGLPVVAAVNVGALTNASAAAASAAMAAQDGLQRDRAAARQALPSVFTVRVLGFGEQSGSTTAPAPGAAAPSNGLLQLVGRGERFDRQQLERLTAEERRALGKQ